MVSRSRRFPLQGAQARLLCGPRRVGRPYDELGIGARP